MGSRLDPRVVKSTFELLKRYNGWLAFVEVAEINAKSLEKSILDGTEDDDTIRFKRSKLQAYREILGIPDYVIRTHTEAEVQDPDDGDPYYKKVSEIDNP